MLKYLLLKYLLRRSSILTLERVEKILGQMKAEGF